MTSTMKKLFTAIIIAATLTGCGKKIVSPHHSIPSYRVSSNANIPGFETPTGR